MGVGIRILGTVFGVLTGIGLTYATIKDWREGGQEPDQNIREVAEILKRSLTPVDKLQNTYEVKEKFVHLVKPVIEEGFENEING